jgi:hypothetical protein
VRPIILTLAILALIVFVDHPTDVVARQEADQPILQSEADFTYGQAMVFRLTVAQMGQVETATLYFRPQLSTDSYAVDVPVTPGMNVQAEYTLDLTQIRIPPFSAVVYWWELTLADGRELQVPEQRLHYTDDQFAWQEEEKGRITVYWAGAEPALGNIAHNAIDRTLLRLGSILPVQQVSPFDVYVYPSTADLAAALRLAGREWREGASYPELGVLLVTAVNANTAEADLGRMIPRELTYLLLYQYAGAGYEQVPVWLREGIVTYVAGEPTPSQQAALEASLATNGIMPIHELCQFQEFNLMPVITAQSESLVRYIGGAYGESVLRRLVGEMAVGGECTAVLETVLGIPVETLQENWLASLQPTTAATSFLSQNILWLVIIAAGFGAMALIVWRPDGGKSNR